MKDYYEYSKIITFNPINYPVITSKIINFLFGIEEAKRFLTFDSTSTKTDSVFETQMEYIKFGYGVKHGFITLSDDTFSKNNFCNEYYKIDLLTVGIYGEGVTSTQMIYDQWRVRKWIHLLP
jgi:hypothetical protein